MTAFSRNIVGAALLLIASVAISSAQVPTRTLMRFTINVPTPVTIGDYLLAPGTYVLFQDSQVPEMFALYRDNMSREPIAQIMTNQTPYWAIRDDRTTRIELKMTESRDGVYPAVKGFNVPFADRWNIVSVSAKHSSTYMTRVK